MILNFFVLSKKPKSKVPHFKELEKETVEFDLKVKEYFKGKMTRPAEVERQTKEVLEIQEKVRTIKCCISQLPAFCTRGKSCAL